MRGEIASAHKYKKIYFDKGKKAKEKEAQEMADVRENIKERTADASDKKK